MKTIAMIAAAVMLTTSAANAGDNYPANFYANCCAVGTVKFRDLKAPTYQSRTVIRSSFGTSVIDSNTYSRPADSK